MDAMAVIYIITLDDISEGKRNVYTLSKTGMAWGEDEVDPEPAALSPPPLPPRASARDPESG